MLSRPVRLLLIVCVPLIAIGIGWHLGVRSQQAAQEHEMQVLEQTYEGSGAVTDPEKTVDISLLWHVWRLLNSNYIDPGKLAAQKLVYGAVRGLVEGVGDPYTVFMTPDESKSFQETLDGDLQGIGAELTLKDGRIVVVSPIKGSPAEAAGLLSGDRILQVDGAPTDGLSLNDVVIKIRGKQDTAVKLLVGRDGSPDRTLTITRRAIHVPSVETAVRTSAAGKVGVITLNQFEDNSGEEVRQAILDFQAQNLKLAGIVIDLRFNGGGYLERAVDIASFFLPKPVKVVTVQHSQDNEEVHDATGQPLVPDLPLVVLVNQGTASASEILAGALQDYRRAVVVGTQSYGKGTVQEIIQLPDGSSLRVTTARWLTPSGRDLGKQGVTPDVAVDMTPDDVSAGKDPQMDRALQWIGARGGKPMLATESPAEPPRAATGATESSRAASSK